jgi:hypothetical protein
VALNLLQSVVKGYIFVVTRKEIKKVMEILCPRDLCWPGKKLGQHLLYEFPAAHLGTFC